MLGAPILFFTLVVNPGEATVSGMVEIQHLSDRENIKINVTGTTRYADYGHVTQIVNLTGDYFLSVPSPAIGSYLQYFSAYLDVNNVWNGGGGFIFGKQRVYKVPVESENK